MNKMGCVLELMVGQLWFGEPAGASVVQKEQIDDLVKLGFFYHGNKNNDEAIKYFKQALKVCQRADLYNNLGAVHLNSGNYAKAMNAFKNALEVDIGYIPAFYNLGVTMYYARGYESAEQIFSDIAGAKDIDNLMLCNAHNDKGCAQNRKSDFEAAEKSFQAALAIDNTFIRPYVNLGNLYCNKGQFDDAKKNYEKALTLDENCSAAYNGLGVVAVEEGDFTKAQAYFEKAFAVDQQCQAAYVNKMILQKNAKEAEVTK